MTTQAPAISHPAPHRDRHPVLHQLAGLVAGPAVWAGQFLFGYAVTSHACFPLDHPLTRAAEGWEWARLGALGVNLLAALICVTAAAFSYDGWRRTRNEAEGEAPHLLDIGEGRTRFLALCGLLTSLVFLVAVLFDTVMLLAAPACRG